MGRKVQSGYEEVSMSGQQAIDPPVEEQVKVCLVGGPGSGKTLLAQSLYVQLKIAQVDCDYISEYARDYFTESGPPLHYLENFVILSRTLQRESRLHHRLNIFDSSSFLSMVYMARYGPSEFATVEERRKWDYCFSAMQHMARERLNWYDHIIFVPPGQFSQDLQPDPARFNPDASAEMGELILEYLHFNRREYYSLAGQGINNRVDEVVGYLQEHEIIPFDLPQER